MIRLPSRRPKRFQLNRASPLANGLVFAGLGQMPGLDRYQDDSLYGNHGTLTGYTTGADAPSAQWQYVPQLRRWGLGFDGTNDYVLCADTGLATTAPKTVAFWLYTPGAVTASRIVNHNIATRQWQIVMADPDGLGVQIGGDNYYGGYATDTYHHFAATFNGSTQSVYRDGKALSVGASTGNTYGGAAGLLLGGRTDIARWLAGWIADPAIWSRVLSVSEIAEIAEPENCCLAVGGVPLIEPPGPRVWAVGAAGAPAGNRRRRVLVAWGDL